jgi:SAM-dependent methyltransferase
MGEQIGTPDAPVAVSPAPTLAPAFDARLEWRSAVATHVDCLRVNANALQGDGRWLAAGTEATGEGGSVRLEATPWLRPAAQAPVELARDGLRLPEDLRPGRFYPAFLFGRALGRPRELGPVRLLGFAPDGRLRVDPNHPLAAQPVSLVLTPASGPAAPNLRLAELFLGPGLQLPPAEPQACYFPAGALARRDDAADIGFYAAPRLVQHLDARCREELRGLYGGLLQPGMRVLDLMASHDSHLPPDAFDVAGIGLNGEELAANPRLAERVVQDLNACPQLPWADGRFDAVVCTASIEYLTQPRAVLAELRRVLRPGGLVAVSFSDRWFPTKAIAVWSRLHEFERLGLVLHLLHDAGFTGLHTETRRGLPRPADDKYAAERASADPLFAAWGYR